MIVLLIVWVDLSFANMCAIMLISATASRVEAKARTHVTAPVVRFQMCRRRRM